MTDESPQEPSRIDRITAPEFVRGLSDLSLQDLRARRDDCLAEREYLSLFRRLIQGRIDILRAELDRRRRGDEPSTLVEHVAEAMSNATPQGTVRGEAVRLTIAPGDTTTANERVEQLVADVSISDPRSLSEDQLGTALGRLETEERSVSADRRRVLDVHDALQDELKRRFKENPAEALAP
ncbi:MAG: aerial mycelium formation protein [Actinomycetota bacterium]